MGSAVEERSESEKTAGLRFVEREFLVVLIDQRDTDSAVDQNVPGAPGITSLVDPLVGFKMSHIYVRREHRPLILVEERE